jgi:hypothetical protein
MDYHRIINSEANFPLPNEYMNVLRKHDRDSYDSRRRQQQMHDPSATSWKEANTCTLEDEHDDGMVEWLDNWFEDTNQHVSNHEQFLRAEATKKLYFGCSLSRLGSSLLILNLQSRFGWNNVSLTTLLS